MDDDLSTLFLDDRAGRDALEAFIDRALARTQASEKLGTFDGIGRLRLRERGPDALRLAGWIFTLDRGECAFWVEVEREGPDHRFRWKLYLGSTETVPRRARNVIDLYDRPEDTGWLVTRTGHGQIRDGVLGAAPRSDGA
jgi:hypothetical protein